LKHQQHSAFGSLISIAPRLQHPISSPVAQEYKNILEMCPDGAALVNIQACFEDKP
jgi:hypothetical protein